MLQERQVEYILNVDETKEVRFFALSVMPVVGERTR